MHCVRQVDDIRRPAYENSGSWADGWIFGVHVAEAGLKSTLFCFVSASPVDKGCPYGWLRSDSLMMFDTI